MRTSFKVVIIALVLFVALMGARNVAAINATAQLLPPGTPVTPSAQDDEVITLDEGKLITLPFPVFSGDVVLLETGVGDVTGAAFPDPSTWSDVVRFCDDPLQDPCQTEFATHVQVMSDQEGATTFIDEFTGHSLDASKLSSNPPAIAIPESTTGPTPYLFYSINSDPTGPGETLEAVGGIVMPANNFAIAAPWLAIIGLVGSLGTVAVVAKKRRE